MTVRIVQFLVIILCALAFVPAGAHLFELPNKIGLPQDQYFIVQSIYRGWAVLGMVWFAAIAPRWSSTLSWCARSAARSGLRSCPSC